MTISSDENIIKLLEDIGYTGPLLDKDALAKALQEGPKSVEYTEIVGFLTNELRSLCSIDEQVNKISAPEDSVSFLMELSSFLKELGCPYDNLTQGHISDRLVEINDRSFLLEYLISDLMSARVLQESKPEKKIELKLQETPNAANMKRILSTLRFPKPPANISVQTLFSKLMPTIQANIKKGGDKLIGNAAFGLTLTDKQWHILNQVQKDLHAEYTIRREMLLKRLDCTIQSFQWSDRMRGKEELITKSYSEKRMQLRVDPEVSLADLIGAREDLAIIEKTSSASVRRNTRSSINRVIIGQVPDRGGRTDELAPPPPEMPSWQQRSGPGGGGRGGGQFQGGGRGRGDFSRGGRGGNRGGGGSDYSRGGGRGVGSNYSRGGGGGYGGRDDSRVATASDYSRGGGGNDYSRGGGGNDYSRGGGGSDYRGGGGSDYRGGGGNDYNRGGGGSDYNRGGGGSDYSRGGGGNDYNRDGGRNDYNRGSGGSDYSRGGGNDYNRGSGGNDYNKGGGNYNRGGMDFDRGQSFDSAGSFGGSNYGRNSSSDYNKSSSGSYGGGRFSSDHNKGSNSDYNRASSAYDSYGSNRKSSFDSAGSYGGSNYSSNFKVRDDYNNTSSDYDSYTGVRRPHSGGFDSSGSYGEPKRAKTYNYFQSNKTTYADQYVQESQSNQQYQPRDSRSAGSGRSSYNRGRRY